MKKGELKELRLYVSPGEGETIKALAGTPGISAYLKSLVIADAHERGIDWPGDTVGRGKYPRFIGGASYDYDKAQEGAAQEVLDELAAAQTVGRDLAYRLREYIPKSAWNAWVDDWGYSDTRRRHAWALVAGLVDGAGEWTAKGKQFRSYFL